MLSEAYKRRLQELSGEVLSEKLASVDDDVEMLYAKYFEKDIKELERTGVITDEMFLPAETNTAMLRSPEAVEANNLNMCIININSGSNFYFPDRNMISISININAIDYVKQHDGNLKRAIDYLDDEMHIRNLSVDFTEERVKGTIHHELAHWIDDTMHNSHIKNSLRKARESGQKQLFSIPVNASKMEIHAQMHNIKQLHNKYSSSWDTLSFMDMINLSPPLIIVHSQLPDSVKKTWIRDLKTRMHREGLLGKNMVNNAISESAKKKLKTLSEWGLVGDETYSDEYVGATIRVEDNAVEILDWNSKENGHGGTMISLKRLKKKYGKDLVAVDCGYPGEPSYTYWSHMCKKGLIVGFYDDNNTYHSFEDVRNESEGKREVIIDEATDKRVEYWSDAIEIAERLYGVNIDPNNYLGGGFWGVAFDVGNGDVVKITEDPEEADKSGELVGVTSKRMADIYSVDRLESNKYAIWQEKLEALPYFYDDAYENFLLYLSDFLGRGVGSGIVSDFLRKGKNEQFIDFLELHMDVSNNYSPIDIYVELLDIAKEASDKGVYLEDIHEGNLGLKNGKLAIFDIS